MNLNRSQEVKGEGNQFRWKRRRKVERRFGEMSPKFGVVFAEKIFHFVVVHVDQFERIFNRNTADRVEENVVQTFLHDFQMFGTEFRFGAKAFDEQENQTFSQQIDKTFLFQLMKHRIELENSINGAER